MQVNVKRLLVEFVIVVAVALPTTATVTYLWSTVGHGAGVIDWETTARFAITFGIMLTWLKFLEIRPGRNSNC